MGWSMMKFLVVFCTLLRLVVCQPILATNGQPILATNGQPILATNGDECPQIFESVEVVMDYGANNCQGNNCTDVCYKGNDTVVSVNPNIFGTQQEAEEWAYKNCQQRHCPDLLAMNYDIPGNPRVQCFDVSRSKRQVPQSSGSITDSMNSNNVINNQAGANTQAYGAGWGSWFWNIGQAASNGLKSLLGYGADSNVANGMQFGLNRFIIGGSGINWLLVPTDSLRKFWKRFNNLVAVGNDRNLEILNKLSKRFEESQNRAQATVDENFPALSGAVAGVNSVGSLGNHFNKLLIDNAHKAIRAATDQTKENLEIVKRYFKPTK